MKAKISITLLLSMTLMISSCNGQETQSSPSTDKKVTTESGEPKKKEPHRYGGWYCPDNFGFEPVDIQKLDEVPAVENRLPTEEELHEHRSLIRVDTEKYPDARALEMELPRVARIYSENKGMSELIIVIQAIIVEGDTVVGYRFPNGGNGSAWLSDVTFLSEDEVSDMGAQPFFYSSSVVNATKEEIWRSFIATDYAMNLAKTFDQQAFFTSEWNPDSWTKLRMDTDSVTARGMVGTVFGNAYLHIDYSMGGFHYSEKMLMIEDLEAGTTELFFACGPFPKDFDVQNQNWTHWVNTVRQGSEAK